MLSARQHDFNGDSFIDGLELYKAYVHSIEDDLTKHPEQNINLKVEKLVKNIEGEFYELFFIQ